MKGFKDIVMILVKKEANLDLFDAVSLHIYILYEQPYITEDKVLLNFS